nr:hypothetical protein CFP56_70880 [Quercus suber]
MNLSLNPDSKGMVPSLLLEDDNTNNGHALVNGDNSLAGQQDTDSYDLWLVVTCKKQGTMYNKRSSGDGMPSIVPNESRNTKEFNNLYQKTIVGLTNEGKRKSSGPLEPKTLESSSSGQKFVRDQGLGNTRHSRGQKVGDHSGGQHLCDSRVCNSKDGLFQSNPSKSSVRSGMASEGAIVVGVQVEHPGRSGAQSSSMEKAITAISNITFMWIRTQASTDGGKGTTSQADINSSDGECQYHEAYSGGSPQVQAQFNFGGEGVNDGSGLALCNFDAMDRMEFEGGGEASATL